MHINDTSIALQVNLITELCKLILLYVQCLFFVLERIFYYAEKPISKNGFCIDDGHCHGACLCIFQPVRCQRQHADERNRRGQRAWRNQLAGRSVYVWANAADLGSSDYRVHFRIFA